MVNSFQNQLFSSLSVSEKYSLLEELRLELDRLYKDDREAYERLRSELSANTWEALEENWKLWDPTPKKYVEWIGELDWICRLKPSHPNYQECAEIGFTECRYDRHGSPDFSEVTFPGSVVDISDLYDELNVEAIKKRGGSATSFQERAQARMAKNLDPVIRKWAKDNNCEHDFYKWRDAHDLVPHEDTDCRTMRLVNRTAHTVFKHRGGVANAINIKLHF